MLENQFHHYIPQFILKNFEKNKGKIKTYMIENKEICLSKTNKIYGIKNMYKDIENKKDCMEIEKKLSYLENNCSVIIKNIKINRNKIVIKRKNLNELKRFLFVMSYRSEKRRLQYYENNFDMDTYMYIKNYRQKFKLKNSIDVWLRDLKYIVYNDHDTIIEKNLIENYGFNNIIKNIIENIHNQEICNLILTDYINMSTCFLCIWEAEEDSEFILTDNCFGAFEGQQPGVVYHYFFIISPKLALVLSNRAYQFNKIREYHKMGFKSSWFPDKYHISPITNYIKNNINLYNKNHYSPNDEFKYTKIKISKKDVYLINSIFLDASYKYISFLSEKNLYKTIRYYDRIKKEMFDNKKDYVTLKKKLFNYFNRIHN